MKSAERLDVAELTQRLAEAEATIAALISGQIDAVVDPQSRTPVLLAKAQAALRISEDRYRRERDRAQRYLDIAGVMLIALDNDGKVKLVNRHACETLGWTSEELLGADWLTMMVPEDERATLEQAFADLLAGDLGTRENSVLTKSGGVLLIEWRNTLLRGDQGEVTGTFSSGTDVTERHRSARKLREAEERMRFALEAAKVGTWDMDYRAGIVRWSETSERQYGLAPGEFSGKFEDFVARIHPDDRAEALATMGAAVQSGADFTTHHRVVWPDGTIRWLSGAGRIHLGADGAPVRGVGISMDVTESHLAQQRDQQSQKMEAIGRLASGVAHDFNNLLTVILGFAEFMSEDVALASQHGKDLGEIIKAAHRAMGLTKQLLAFSRQQVMHTTPLDLNVLITEMSGMFGRLIGEQIRVTMALAPELPLALADRSQMEQVIMNLVVNAKDAMTDGGKLTIATAVVSLDDFRFDQEAVVPGDYVMLAFADTGAGMTRETQQRLFEPFFTTKEAGKGTGLGLSTTYGIVKQSKGYIRVFSELGQGTTFEVYLPCPALPVAAEADVAAAASGPTHSETVLLVEDEESVRKLSVRILSKAGFRVLAAANGEEAERLFVQHAGTIDLVLTDMVMPGCGGPALISRLRRHEPLVKALYMSGYTDEVDVYDNEIPLNFVQKPFDAIELVRRVRAAVAA